MLLFIFLQVFSFQEICHSNTSHVIVYRARILTFLRSYCHSNTSHVIVYLFRPRRSSCNSHYSNTSHVIVYRRAHGQDGGSSAFKYISCYCLSTLETKSNWFWLYSNISHVIVYPSGGSGSAGRKGIQIHLMLLFII